MSIRLSGDPSRNDTRCHTTALPDPAHCLRLVPCVTLLAFKNDANAANEACSVKLHSSSSLSMIRLRLDNLLSSAVPSCPDGQSY